MFVPDEIRKCVMFVGLRLASGEFRLLGSAFLWGRGTKGEGRPERTYAVTARHIIDQIRATGAPEVWLRLNVSDGSSEWRRTHVGHWFVHPTDSTVDVAIHPAGLSRKYDHLVFPEYESVTAELMAENEVGLGEEVFVTGLFRHHHGTGRNIPIVRIGNLACMTEERVSTAFGAMDAYLIEARSIGGLSGSPVFLNLGSVRVIKNQLKFRQGNPMVYLLGLIHGHFDVPAPSIDHVVHDTTDGALSVEQVNTGIAVVVPVHAIADLAQAFEEQHP